jgi:hypothetical protein
MAYLILANEEQAVARSGAGWFEDMRDKKGSGKRGSATTLLITPGAEGLLTQQETGALVASLDPINWPTVGAGQV